MFKTLNECAAAYAELLNLNPELLPSKQVRVVAEIRSQKGRKKKGNASAANFDASDTVVIRFEQVAEDAMGSARPQLGGQVNLAEASTLPAEELLLALQKAERNPDHSFVALKWFRDTFLPKTEYGWAQDSAQRHHWLREAISQRWITADKLANPRNPAFPTTAIRVNRGNPDVQRMLGLGAHQGFGWTPVPIQGEPMSETLRRMRDEGY
ncbi:MAG: hypothetical protein ACRD01_09080 [Terriglobales bacterium]